jgi:hypothetical protein
MHFLISFVHESEPVLCWKAYVHFWCVRMTLSVSYQMERLLVILTHENKLCLVRAKRADDGDEVQTVPTIVHIYVYTAHTYIAS